MAKYLIFNMSTKVNLNKKYQKKTDIEHILDVPDTYIGKIDIDEKQGFILKDKTENSIGDESNIKMVYKTFSWIPGMFKCFDEGIVNARDHIIRMQQLRKQNKGKKNIIQVKNVDITVDPEKE